jgi:hypothetical protein
MRKQLRKGRSKRHSLAALVAGCLATALAASACTGSGGGSTASEKSTPVSAESPPAKIPQPILEKNLPVAPESQRVDVTTPTFSHPTDVTNPLYPISSQHSVLFVGHVDDKPFRTEVTLLPETRIIQWEGQEIEALVSQYVAYLDGRITEVAFDFYAQADDGSVWYLGEDVSDFVRGAIVTKEGTWLAGKDGPAAMIMPADPKVGNVWRTENIPGIAFEEVSVKTVNKTLTGPLGSVKGGLIAGELHMDATSEDKTFAPGYGEFLTSGAGDVEALALAVPTDALGKPEPKELSVLKNGALTVLNAVEDDHWNAASATVADMVDAWHRYPTGAAPARVSPRMTATLRDLAHVVGGRNRSAARQAAIDAAQWALDLALLYRPAQEVDLGRFALWAAQLQIDADNRKPGPMRGDFFTIDLIRDRVLGVLDDAEINRINLDLEELEGAVMDGDYAAARAAAGRLRTTLSGIEITT